MRILFLYDNLSLGGIQTLIVRLARELAGRGHDVTVLLNRQGSSELFSRLRESSKVVVEKTTLNIPLRFHTSITPQPDVIMAWDTCSLIEAVSLGRHCFPSVRVTAGVFHPREFCAPRERERLRDRLGARILRRMPPENILFMNEHCRAEHAERWGNRFGRSWIIPLPVDVARYAAVERHPAPDKLVSIGRLTAFKTYNRTMIPLLAEMRRGGHCYEYHVYGDGPERPFIQRLVRRHEVGDLVRLHGEVPYRDLPAVLADAHAFIGMGTALVEASACGVPSIVAVESARAPRTYGFFHELDDLNTGEYVAGRTTHDIQDKLLALPGDGPEYLGLCARARRKAGRFAIGPIVTQYEAWLSQAALFRAGIPAWFGAADVLGTAWLESARALGFDTGASRRYLK